MPEISEDRLKRFWDWCGFTEVLGQEMWRFEKYKETNHWWKAPNGQRFVDWPPIDLNNLFKWAVPKVLEEIGRERLVALVNNALCDSIEAKGDVKDYLFLAIEQLIKEGL